MHMPGLMLDLSRAHAWGEAHSTAISSTDSILNMNESDLRSDVHYLGSSENKAWKKKFHSCLCPQFKYMIFIYS